MIVQTNIFQSCLSVLDEINFEDSMIEKYYEMATKFVYRHFETSVENEILSIDESPESITGNVDVNSSNSEMNYLENHKRLLYEKVLKRKQSRSKHGSESVLSLDKKKQELFTKINKKMEEYREESGELDVLKWLNEHGNELYQSLKDKKNGIDFKKIKEHDVIYISNIFDVLEWWKIKEKTYPELAVGACIVLGKPTHNAFQERVFSRGTYTDTKLRKQLKEESFEMSVLNAVNSRTIESCSDMIDEINNKIFNDLMNKKKKDELVAEEVQTFMTTREKEQRFDMDNIDNIIEAEISTDEDEVISICSENTYDNDFDDDDEDDDEIFNQVLAKHWVKNTNENIEMEIATVPTSTTDNNNNNNLVEEIDETMYM